MMVHAWLWSQAANSNVVDLVMEREKIRRGQRPGRLAITLNVKMMMLLR